MKKLWRLIILVSLISCEKGDPSPAGIPEVTTASFGSITESSARGGGDVTDDGGGAVTAKGICWSSSAGPSIDDDLTNEGTGNGHFVSTVTGLDPQTTYYLRAYATNYLGTGYGNEHIIRTTPEAVTDHLGNAYSTVEIGNQVWMAENLKLTAYADGKEIPLVEGIAEWNNLKPTDKAYCWYGNNTLNGTSYGTLYTWAAAMNGAASSDSNPSGVRGVCPAGWHLPSDEEWKELELYLGMSPTEADESGYRGINVGSRLAADPTLWPDGYLINNAVFGTSGFTALPGGGRRYNGSFGHLGDNANFWTATEHDHSVAWGRHLYATYSSVHRYPDIKSDGFSVRCVRDH